MFGVCECVVQDQVVFGVGVQYFDCQFFYVGDDVVWFCCIVVWYVFVGWYDCDDVDFQVYFGDCVNCVEY